jgi:hypothetical protein
MYFECNVAKALRRHLLAGGNFLVPKGSLFRQREVCFADGKFVSPTGSSFRQREVHFANGNFFSPTGTSFRQREVHFASGKFFLPGGNSFRQRELHFARAERRDNLSGATSIKVKDAHNPESDRRIKRRFHRGRR